MLVLTRKKGKAIKIKVGEVVIRISVVDIQPRYFSEGWQVRLGFEAPPGVTILREEVVDRRGG
jgi:carbon storage regulator CsrA